MFWGFPNGVTMPQRFAASACSAKTAGTSRGWSDSTRAATESGSMMTSATSFVNAIEKTAVTSTSVIVSVRGLPKRAMAARAAQSKTPAFRSALATASTQNRQPIVFQSKYPRYSSSGGTRNMETRATNAAVPSIQCLRSSCINRYRKRTTPSIPEISGRHYRRYRMGRMDRSFVPLLTIFTPRSRTWRS